MSRLQTVLRHRHSIVLPRLPKHLDLKARKRSTGSSERWRLSNLHTRSWFIRAKSDQNRFSKTPGSFLRRSPFDFALISRIFRSVWLERSPPSARSHFQSPVWSNLHPRSPKGNDQWITKQISFKSKVRFPKIRSSQKKQSDPLRGRRCTLEKASRGDSWHRRCPNVWAWPNTIRLGTAEPFFTRILALIIEENDQ